MRSGRSTGLWFDEFAIPYSVFKSHGLNMTIASPKGGIAPIDPQSLAESQADNPAAKAALANTLALDEVVDNMFDALYIPGGNGTMYDLAKNALLEKILQQHIDSDCLIASVCHGAVCFTSLRQNGIPYVSNRAMTCFSNAEEHQTGAAEEYDFLVEDKCRELGAKISIADPWQEHTVQDGKLITGQNPQSCERLAKVLVDKLS